jgi:hypothetical protein
MNLGGILIGGVNEKKGKMKRQNLFEAGGGWVVSMGETLPTRSRDTFVFLIK